MRLSNAVSKMLLQKSNYNSEQSGLLLGEMLPTLWGKQGPPQSASDKGAMVAMVLNNGLPESTL